MRPWKDLSMKERGAFIRVGVKNGITSVDGIRDAYNKFACGGYLFKKGGNKRTGNPVTDNPANQGLTSGEKIKYILSYPLRKYSEEAMKKGQAHLVDRTNVKTLEEIYGPNSPRNNYLVSKKLADIAMRKEGWLRGVDEDYGLLDRHVRETYGSLPVYQQNKDADNVTRDRLVAIGNRNNIQDSNLGVSQFEFGQTRSSLPNPGTSSSSFYIDPYTNKFYQKQWDVERFGKGNFYQLYTNPKKWLAGRVDAVGHPMVLTTGFQPISAEHINPETDELEYGKHFTLDDILAVPSNPADRYNYAVEHGIIKDVMPILFGTRHMMDDFMSKRKIDENPDNNGLFVIEDIDGTGRNAYGLKEVEVKPEKSNKKSRGGRLANIFDGESESTQQMQISPQMNWSRYEGDIPAWNQELYSEYKWNIYPEEMRNKLKEHYNDNILNVPFETHDEDYWNNDFDKRLRNHSKAFNKIYTTLADRGLTDDAIAAYMGNIIWESGDGDILAQDANGRYIGLFQYDDDGWKRYEKWRDNNKLKNTVENQIRWELEVNPTGTPYTNALGNKKGRAAVDLYNRLKITDPDYYKALEDPFYKEVPNDLAEYAINNGDMGMKTLGVLQRHIRAGKHKLAERTLFSNRILETIKDKGWREEYENSKNKKK